MGEFCLAQWMPLARQYALCPLAALKRRINYKMHRGKSCHVCKPGFKRGQNTSIQGQGKMSHLKPNAREQPVHGVSMAKQMPSAINAVIAKPCRQTGKHSKNRRHNGMAADGRACRKKFLLAGFQAGMQLFFLLDNRPFSIQVHGLNRAALWFLVQCHDKLIGTGRKNKVKNKTAPPCNIKWRIP